MSGLDSSRDVVELATDPALVIAEVAATGRGAREVSASSVDRLARAPGGSLRRALEAVLMEADPAQGLIRLQAAGVLAVVLPELERTVALSAEADNRHKDVWAHTVKVVTQSPARPTVRWAALLHDIGKAHTRRFRPDGTVTFQGHAELGAALFWSDIAPRLALVGEEARAIFALIANHQRPSGYGPGWGDSAVRRLGRDLGPWLGDLLDLSRADVTSRIPGRREEALRLIDELAARHEALAAEDARPPALPAGLGHAIMERFGLAPGREVGRLRGLLVEAVQRGDLRPGLGAEQYLAHLERLLSPGGGEG